MTSVLKKINAAFPPERTRYALLYHAHMHAAGTPCPDPHATVDGHHEALFDGQRLCFQAWSPGDRIEIEALPTESRRHLRR